MSEQYNLQPGSLFAGDYRIVRSLSAGGMGAVYVAEQLSTGKQRALKVMLASLVADPALRKRFEQEARIGSLIESEHVVEVVGAGIDAPTGLPWLAMELLHGEELAKVIETRGPMAVQDVLAVFEQLCHAVGAAHRVGVVHRDLKPENVFLAQAKRAGAVYMVKVLDFGIAKIVAEASTKQTAAMGSPIWMAPEQADQSPITPGTDVWALGLIAFYLLTGRSYWRSANDDNATVPQVLKEVLFEPIVPASQRTAELGRAVPRGFDAWFAACVARDPRSRFPDASQAWAALAPALTDGGPMPASVLGYAATSAAPASAYLAPSAPATVDQGPYGVPPTVGSAPTGYAPGMGPVGTGPQGVPAPGSAMAASAPPAVAATGGSYTLPTGPQVPGTGPVVPPKKSSAGLVVGVGLAVLLAGGLGGGLWWSSKHSASATAVAVAPSASAPAHATSEAPDMAIVDEAKKLSDDGKYDMAHRRLAQVPAGSDARQSSEFKDIEFKWATETLLLADRAPDAAAKRALLQAVADCPTVDETLRSSARERLAALDTPDASVKPHPVASFHGTTMSQTKGEGVVINANQPEVVAPSTTLVPPPPAPPQRSLYDLANSAASADWWTARRVLEPKVLDRSATNDEVRLLTQICKNQRDKACLKECARALKR